MGSPSQRRAPGTPDIIGDKHRAEEGDVNQGQDAHAGVSEELDHLFGQDIKEADIFQGAHHRQHAEQAGQRLEIKIAGIGPVGGMIKLVMTAAARATVMTVFILTNVRIRVIATSLFLSKSKQWLFYHKVGKMATPAEKLAEPSSK